MVRRLLLVRHAPTAATGRAFAADEPILDPGAVTAALAGRLPSGAGALSSPKLRCIQTAAAAGMAAAIEPRLTECDFGTWEGTPFTDTVWPSDPDAAPHGGESLNRFFARVAGWLGSLPEDALPLVAFTHAGVIRAAVAHALGGTIDAFWRVEVAPLSVVELHGYDDDTWGISL